MTRKVKLNHGSGVEGRVAHLTNSYFDEDYVKTDFLILDEEAIKKWDQGFLDDPSITAVPSFDMKASRKTKPTKLVIESLRGTGFDFVDRPACKTCGIDSVLAQLEEEVSIEHQDNTNSLNNNPPETDENRTELEDESMTDNQTLKEKIQGKFTELSELITSAFESNEGVEDMTEETVVEQEEQVETPVETDSTEEIVENESNEEIVEEVEEVETPTEELEDDNVEDEKLSEAERKLEARLSKIESTYEAKIKKLEAKVEQEELEAKESRMTKLSEDVKELSLNFKTELGEVKLEDVDVTDPKEVALAAQKQTLEAILRQYPGGELPDTSNTLLEEQKEEIEKKLGEMEEENLFRG
jgi:hypothetical protein